MESLSGLAAEPQIKYWDSAAWYLVTCPDGDYARLQEYGTEDEVANALRELDDTDTVAFVIHGRQAKISKRPQRFLIMPDNEQVVPLFDMTELGVPDRYTPQGLDLIIQDDGYLGLAELTIPVPKHLHKLDPKHLPMKLDQPPRQQQAVEDDDDESDEDDEENEE